MTKRNLIGMSAIMIIASLVWASNALAGSWVQDLTVKGVHAGHDVDHFYVYTVEASTEGCELDQSHTWLFWSNDTTGGRRSRAYSTLLLAETTGQKVKLYFNSCEGGFPSFDSVIIGNW